MTHPDLRAGLLLLSLWSSLAQTLVALPSLKDAASERDAWTNDRINMVLPALMEEYDVDAWLLVMQEYNEDPVFLSLSSATQYRTQVLLYSSHESQLSCRVLHLPLRPL